MCKCGLNCLWQALWPDRNNAESRSRSRPRGPKPVVTTANHHHAASDESLRISKTSSPVKLPQPEPELEPYQKPTPQAPIPKPLLYYPRPLLGHQQHDSSAFTAFRADAHSEPTSVIVDGFHPVLLGGAPREFFQAAADFGARLDGPLDLKIPQGGGGGSVGASGGAARVGGVQSRSQALQRLLPDSSSRLGLFHSGSSALALASSSAGAGVGAAVNYVQQPSSAELVGALQGLQGLEGLERLAAPHALLSQDAGVGGGVDAPQSPFGRPSGYQSHQISLPLDGPFEQLSGLMSGQGQGQGGRLKQAPLGRALRIEGGDDDDGEDGQAGGYGGRGRQGGGGGGRLTGTEGTVMRLSDVNGKKNKRLGFRDGL